jgi:heavy metal translocating P-type ATPase
MKQQRAGLEAIGAGRKQGIIAGFTLAAIALHLLLRFGVPAAEIRGVPIERLPLILCLILGGGPLVFGLVGKLIRGRFGSDALAGISIVASALLGEYLAGSLVVLMLSGGEALEAYAVRSASSVLEALARRMPSGAHRRRDGILSDVPLEGVAPGDELVVLPHEICPVDGTVLEGRGTMDESFLTGEPYQMSKATGSGVISGAVNGMTALTIRAEKRSEDSRYARIMRVMRASEQRRPRLRRLGDRLGASYTPLAVAIALAAWAASGEPTRFLAVLVVATPCPLLIAIPVAIIGAISLAARRGIVIKDPAVLEAVDACRTAIFDKTGTLTYGRPQLTEVIPRQGLEADEVLTLVASLERYSKHPLASAILVGARASGVKLREVDQVQERPGDGLTGRLGGRTIQITGRKQLVGRDPQAERELPAVAGGLECVTLIDGRYAATLRFRDRPRAEGPSFIHHLGPRHHFGRVMLVTGDRESEARYLAELVGIEEVLAGQAPEQKLEVVRRETRRAKTLYLGDGINDAPALTAATVGIALGRDSDITAEAAGAVILDSSLLKVDELLHIGRRLRMIALQSAVGGMALSLVGMAIAAAGYLSPVTGAIAQEVIDVLAVGNALRMAIPSGALTDYEGPRPQEDAGPGPSQSTADAGIEPDGLAARTR